MRRVVDREARNTVAQYLEDVLAGKSTAIDIVEEHLPSLSSPDPAVCGVLCELERLSLALDAKDCGLWENCDEKCFSCRLFPRRSGAVRCSRAKREMTRAIEFLRSDSAYRWDEGLRIPWWMALPAGIVLIVGIMVAMALAQPFSQFFAGHVIQCDESTFLPANCIGFAVIWLASCSWLANRALGKDRRYWPFYGPREWEAFRNRTRGE